MTTKKPVSTPAATLVGSALGSFAKRVGALVSEVSQAVTLPEEIRRALEEGRKLRHVGNFAGALAALSSVNENQRNEANLVNARWLTQATAWWWGDQSEATCTERPELLRHLVAAESAARSGLWDQALESGRRALRTPGKAATSESAELGLFTHWLVATAYAHVGAFERALHELSRSEALTRELALPLFWRKARALGVDWALRAGNPERAEGWLALADRKIEAVNLVGVTLPESHEPSATVERAALVLRLKLALGADDEAAELTKALPEGRARLEAQVRGALASAKVDALARQRAVELARHEDPNFVGARLWALGELQAALFGLGHVSPGAVLDVFDQAVARSRGQLELAWRHERAYAALVLDRLTWPRPDLDAQQTERRPALDHEHVQEAAEFEVLHWLNRDDATVATTAHELAKLSGRLASESTLDLALGVDELSPLRQGSSRQAVALAHVHRRSAQVAANAGELERALDEHARALLYLPSLHASSQAIDQAFAKGADHEQAWLVQALRLLDRMVGHGHDDHDTAIREVARQVRTEVERPRRALSVAVVGEFSAGKSSLVNAILGQSLSPVGVLPTTKTVLRFRQGTPTTGSATRLVDTAGRVRLIEADETTRYLNSLSPEEAREVATIECFGAWSRLGDVVLIDTPGLNAGDDAHEEATRHLVDEIDALIWVFSATRAGAASEVAAIRQWLHEGHAVIAVLNKTDALEAAEVDALIAYLHEALPELPIVPMCTTGTRTVPGRAGDSVDQLFAAWGREFVGKKAAIQIRVAAHRARQALDALLETRHAKASQPGATAPALVHDKPDTASDWPAMLRTSIQDLDDLLMREVLALGLLPTQGAKGEESVDWDALGDRLGSQLFARLARMGAHLGSSTPHSPQRAAWQDFLGWARGAWAGAQQHGGVTLALRNAALGSEGGEQGLKQSLRAVLTDLAETWAVELRATLRRHHPRHNAGDHQAPEQRLREFWQRRLEVVLASHAQAQE